jgi:hypothetical protein
MYPFNTEIEICLVKNYLTTVHTYEEIITFASLDVIDCCVMYLQRYVSETGFCLRLHVEPTQ